MKNQRKYIVTILSIFIMSIILYLSDGITAMADGQTEAYAAVPGVSGETASPEAFLEPTEGSETYSE